ncbi:MAG: hypothetical protein K2P95_05060 [Hyphomonadaceae bacterium]|nr:hypothetical protein [Hyphomonadaceae bacterium]
MNAVASQSAPAVRLHAFELVREKLEAAPLDEDSGSLPPKRRAAQVRKALYHPDFERSAFSRIAPMLLRLSELALLQSRVGKAGLIPRDEADIAAELDRIGLRIMLREQLLERIESQQAEPHVKAAALLALVAKGSLPRGRCCALALDTARQILASPAIRGMMRRNPQVREQLIQRLVEAEAQMAA